MLAKSVLHLQSDEELVLATVLCVRLHACSVATIAMVMTLMLRFSIVAYYEKDVSQLCHSSIMPHVRIHSDTRGQQRGLSRYPKTTKESRCRLVRKACRAAPPCESLALYVCKLLKSSTTKGIGTNRYLEADNDAADTNISVESVRQSIKRPVIATTLPDSTAGY